VSGLAHGGDGPLPALTEADAAVCVIAAHIKFVHDATGGDFSLFAEAMEDIASNGSDMEVELAFSEAAFAPI
jgi:hypothetical protein